MKKTGLKGSVKVFPVDYNPIDNNPDYNHPDYNDYNPIDPNDFLTIVDIS